jgi:hypothetical protein
MSVNAHMTKECLQCGKRFKVIPSNASKREHCSKACLALTYKVRLRGDCGPNFKHGFTSKPKRRFEYSVWASMLTRCHNPKSVRFYNYGGRGISVCERWATSFENFLDDMGFAPSPAYSIDRINNDGNYEPGNCRWATRKEQSNNTRFNRTLVIDGVSKTLTQWAESSGLGVSTIWARLNVYHWPESRALSPVDAAQSARRRGKKR